MYSTNVDRLKKKYIYFYYVDLSWRKYFIIVINCKTGIQNVSLRITLKAAVN